MQFTHSRLVRCLGVAAMVTAAPFVQGQAFNSGSTGADGPLNLTTPGTVVFDPVALGLHPAVDNVFNFTTINISTGVTVKLTSKVLTGPIYWLAQGAVTITGVIDASGETGYALTNNVIDRVSAAGGAGGYSGGLGGNGGSLLPTAGNGPGGSPGTITNNPATTPTIQYGGTFTGSQYLIPLIGGSGGGGGVTGGCGTYGPGGGGGGGAILIASSVSITLNNNSGTAINARGGNSGGPCGGVVPGGSGGAARLVAPAITLPNVAASIDVRGGSFGGGDGVVRLEAFTFTRISPTNDVGGRVITSTPFTVVPPSTAPSSIQVTSINGITINANPFSFPDATINTASPVTVNVQAQYIPLGTVPKIIVSSEAGTDVTVNCSPLTGTLQVSTCSAPITFATGGSRGFVKATW
jgi:hypothetical protein